MGYSHYFRRVPELGREAFMRAVEDVGQIFDRLKEQGVQLAGPCGTGRPELSDYGIAFNGRRDCGHKYLDLGKPWPSKTAEGVEATSGVVVGPWFSGALLETRVCGGCCANDAFVVDRRFLARSWDQLEQGRYFSACETAFKPYDLAVTAVLIRLKERCGDEITISSDNIQRGFEDAKRICRELFGFTSRFELEQEEPELV